MYEVVKYTTDSMETVGTTTSLDRAGLSAQSISLEDGVSEVCIFDCEGSLVEVWVDGNKINAEDYFAQDCEEYDFDEVGFDPYTGCGGWDC
jgi:hypothetical protein